MKYEEIIKLLDAGYTREEILEMKNDDASAITNDPEVQPASDDIIADVNNDVANAISEMKNAVAEFKKEIQAFNIMNSQIDIPETSTEDLIGKIINPFTEN